MQIRGNINAGSRHDVKALERGANGIRVDESMCL